MPTITTVDATWTNGVAMDEAELRRSDSAMFLGDGSNNGVRGGIVRHGDNSLAVSVNGSDQVTVQSGAAVIPAATGLGVYRAALSAATAATGISSRNATNPRIDLVVMQIVSGRAEVKTVDGTPGSSPSAPALPANAVELARLNVPALGGGAVTVTASFRQYAAALGGTLYVETAARLPGSGNQKGQRAVAIDTGFDYRWSGTAWIPQGVGVDYTPAVSGLTTDTTKKARYVRNGQQCTVRFSIPSTGTSTLVIEVSLPFPARVPDTPYGVESVVGIATGKDTGTAYHAGVPLSLTSVNTVAAYERNAAAWGNGVPFAWASGDLLTGALTYEVADGS